jgi:purine-binding chemotaxis protein CheW
MVNLALGREAQADANVALGAADHGCTVTALTSSQLVVFSLGEEEYALPITAVQEIIRYHEPRGIASDVEWVVGVISLRGKIVPVIDLALRLGSGPDGPVGTKIVIVETGDGMAGVVVDEVDEVLTVEEGALENPPGASSDLIQMIARVEDRLIVLLAPDLLLAGVQLAAGPVAA